MLEFNSIVFEGSGDDSKTGDARVSGIRVGGYQCHAQQRDLIMYTLSFRRLVASEEDYCAAITP